MIENQSVRCICVPTLESPIPQFPRVSGCTEEKILTIVSVHIWKVQRCAFSSPSPFVNPPLLCSISPYILFQLKLLTIENIFDADVSKKDSPWTKLGVEKARGIRLKSGRHAVHDARLQLLSWRYIGECCPTRHCCFLEYQQLADMMVMQL